MKESNVHNKLLTVMVSLLIVGSAAAVITIYHETKHIEKSLEFAMDEDDGVFFV